MVCMRRDVDLQTLAAVSQPYPGSLGGHAKQIPGSAGFLLPGMEARILRDDGSDVAVNEVGELFVKGGIVALGYWNNDKANKETFFNG